MLQTLQKAACTAYISKELLAVSTREGGSFPSYEKVGSGSLLRLGEDNQGMVDLQFFLKKQPKKSPKRSTATNPNLKNKEN